MSSEEGSVGLVPLRWWHVAAVAALDAEIFGATAWSAESFWSELAAPGRTYLLALRPGADPAAAPAPGDVLGFAGLAVFGDVADVQTIAVAPPARGRGLARRLLAALVEHAGRAGAVAVMLEVRADNAPARALYASFGFEPVSVRRGYYRPGVDAIVMRRPVRG